jgi:hypothetical protein
VWRDCAALGRAVQQRSAAAALLGLGSIAGGGGARGLLDECQDESFSFSLFYRVLDEN